MCDLGESHHSIELDGKQCDSQRTDEEERVDCRICTRPIPLNPTTLGCGHTFCRICVEGLVIDGETMPLGRFTADLFCPVCSRGDAVRWIIDGSCSNAAGEEYSLATVKYEVCRKRLMQKYRQHIHNHLRYWREISDQLNYDQDQFNCNADDSNEEYRRLCAERKGLSDDVRGINHVTGRFMECIVLQGQNSLSDPRIDINCKLGNVDIAKDKSGTLTSASSNYPQLHEAHASGNLKFGNTSDSNFEQDESRRTVMDYKDENGHQQRVGLPHNQSDRGKKAHHPGTSHTSIQIDKLEKKRRAQTNTYTDQNFREDSETTLMCRGMDEWCAHLSLVGFIVLISIVIVLTTILRNRPVVTN
ncbi:hypothetical protein BSL78_06908 [Apostichopus japonicus]|uniref:RING-type domain-containing protein n=1 Tax=Stichopus japonicus TaxID=307972 RepID=A0A2G8L7P8_STIJA|nr:hypothetical protein BSL78_06908 [Apostichopus japonicus]